MTIHLHKNDLPRDISLGNFIAIDTEAMGLYPHRDRLCLVQLSSGDKSAHLVQFTPDGYQHAHHLKSILQDPAVKKIFHFARFDVAVIQHYLGISVTNIFCTKIASKLTRTYTDKHGLKDLCKNLLGIEVSKQEQSSDWGQETLTPEQMAYAASDVLHLHLLMDVLQDLLAREGKTTLAEACFNFIPTRASLDLLVREEYDIFAH